MQWPSNGGLHCLLVGWLRDSSRLTSPHRQVRGRKELLLFPPEDYAPNLLLGPAYERRSSDGHLGHRWVLLL